MTCPFKIFPTSAYLNDQLSIVSDYDNLIVKFYFNEEEKMSINLNSNFSSILSKLNIPGSYKAVCEYDGVIYEQYIYVKDAYRLGTSELKKAYLFDGIKYSFLLMKDRLLLYSEDKNEYYSENDISPSDILEINNKNVLFVTKKGIGENSIVNYGIYNVDNFSIIGELLNTYNEVKLNVNSNKLWVTDIKNNDLVCFEIISDSNVCFREIIRYKKVSRFIFNKPESHIFIFIENSITIVNLNNLVNNHYFNSSNSALDINGFVYQVKDDFLFCNNFITGYESGSCKLEYDLHFDSDVFLHIGDLFKSNRVPCNFENDVKLIVSSELCNIDLSEKYHYYTLPEGEVLDVINVTNQIFPTFDGILIFSKIVTSKFVAITFRKNADNIWQESTKINNLTTYSLEFISESGNSLLFDNSSFIKVNSYNCLTLIVSIDDKTIGVQGSNIVVLNNESRYDFFEFPNFNSNFLLGQKGELFFLYNISNLNNILLKNVDIYNYQFILKHEIIWFSSSSANNTFKYLKGYSLKSKSFLNLDNIKKHYKEQNDAILNFSESYFEYNNKLFINPKTTELKEAIIGDALSVSESLNKVISRRDNLYYFQVFDYKIEKYIEVELHIMREVYKEAYLYPDGKFLILKNSTNEYTCYDILNDKILNFFSGNFVAFSKEGKLIFESDKTRDIKIIDPLTFLDITPPNYHYYRFLSPDGKLYSQLSMKRRFINKLNGDEMGLNDVIKYRSDLDSQNLINPINLKLKKIYDAKMEIFYSNRKKVFELYANEFNQLKIYDYKKISSYDIIRVDQYTEIGIVGTSVFVEVLFPGDLQFYNYASFSYNNKYFGYVGKPVSRGLINLFKIDFDEAACKLSITNVYESRLPNYASWVCGFSKTGYFATYDSNPDTYLVECDDSLFDIKTDDHELKTKIMENKINISYKYAKWSKIEGKNFLCFSPTGRFLALSEQGYDPLTLGGYGHQESNVLHIAETETTKLVNSFLGHGEIIQQDKNKKVTFVAFSENENEIMSMSADGVVIVRKIQLGVKANIINNSVCDLSDTIKV